MCKHAHINRTVKAGCNEILLSDDEDESGGAPSGFLNKMDRKLGVLQCVAVCCSVLQCVAVRCSVL